jgi:hypothetical protein
VRLNYREPDESSPHPNHISLRSILLLYSHLHPRLPSGVFPWGFPNWTFVRIYLMRVFTFNCENIASYITTDDKISLYRAGEPIERLPKVARRKIFLVLGIHCCPGPFATNVVISWGILTTKLCSEWIIFLYRSVIGCQNRLSKNAFKSRYSTLFCIPVTILR